MTRAAEDQRIRSLRPPKPSVDPWKAHGALVEDERRPNGDVERALTVFLAGAECAFTCSFCDLWRYTTDGPTPHGAIPAQIAESIADITEPLDRLKLYNASNFFDPRAVPTRDLPRIIELSAAFSGVTVESHARTIRRSTIEFARRLRGETGARLEVAIGLETIHPDAVSRLNKRLNSEIFERAADQLIAADVDLRVFVLLGAPGIPRAESILWTFRSVAHAIESGAAVVSIIPIRGGNGEMERLAALGLFSPPSLIELEAALDTCVVWSDSVVTADLWDAERLDACPACRDARIARMRRINVSGVAEPPVHCSCCTFSTAERAS